MAVRFSELLLREGRITQAQLDVALNHQRASGGRLGATLVRLGMLGDEDVALALSRQHGVPSIQLGELDLDPEVIRLVPTFVWSDRLRPAVYEPIHAAVLVGTDCDRRRFAAPSKGADADSAYVVVQGKIAL